jgi:hypothetical protein
MKARLVTILVAATLCVSQNYRAIAQSNDPKSANFMMQGCRNFASETAGDSGFMGGWCAGILDGITYMDPDLCIPDGVPQAQVARVVVQYIDQRPARMHESFKLLAIEALRSAWPCQR